MEEKIDDTTIEKDFRDHIRSLNQELRNFIASPTTIESVRRIGSECGLSDTNILELLDEVGLTLIGFGPPEEFKTQLAERLPSSQKVELIAQRIDEELFTHIRNELDYLYNETPIEKPKLHEIAPANEIVKSDIEQLPPTPPISTPSSEEQPMVPQSDKAPFPELTFHSPKPEWKPEEHLITPHPSLPGERSGDAIQPLANTTQQQKIPASIFEQKVSDFYKAPKENGASGEIKDPYREPTA